MFKILVVDDEPISVESVVYMIDKNFDNAKVIATSRSGKDAIEKAITYTPDVVIMDIKMQGINGLEAVKQIKRNRPDTSFIILSAFDYFDYALESIALDIKEYLVKPVKEARFVEALANTITGHAKKTEERRRMLAQQERLEMVMPIVETGFINSLCMFGTNAKELVNYCRILGHEKNSGYVIVIEFGEKNINQTENRIGAGVQGEKWHDECQRIMKSLYDCIVGPIMLNRLIMYVFSQEENADSQQKSASLEIAHNFLKRVQHYCSNIYIGIGAQVGNVSNASCSYHEALRALHILSIYNKQEIKQILHVDDIIENNGVSTYDGGEQAKKIIQKMEHCGENEVLAVFNDFYLRVSAQSKDYKILANQMINLVVGLGKRWSIVLADSSAILQRIVQTGDAQSLKQIMDNWIMQAIHQIYTERKRKVNSIIEKANRFIDENYAKQIQLKDIAKEVNLSTYYFSRFYKEETGMNFSDKLLNVRMEKAKQILISEDISVKNVSYMVGYLEPTYFSKIFKKITGYTAGEYKKLLDHQ